MCGFVSVDEDVFEERLFDEALKELLDRGPDQVQKKKFLGRTFGFDRLAIMDLSSKGMQPFEQEDLILVCNGEIYNSSILRESVKDEFKFKSSSDCEVILPLYKKYGLEIMSKMLDGEFALCIYDGSKGKMLAARDPMGIRPLFYGYTKHGKIAFASEGKALYKLGCKEIMPFPPGCYYDGKKFICYNDLSFVDQYSMDSISEISTKIEEKLTKAVEKRLQSDAPIGFLLSGGLDSSLVCAIATKILKQKAKKEGKKYVPIKTFAIGMDIAPIDLKYAREVADFLGTDHTEVIMTKEEVLKTIKPLIKEIETWDITTIRASIGMYLLCKYIYEKTDIKVILTGEVSDEIFGYKYTDFAPSPEEFQKESKKRIKELYMYDVLRADRCISRNSLEGRVPFADTEFVRYCMSIDPAKKMNTYKKGKYLLRHAFEGKGYLPDDILMREKAAFSDAVGHSMVDDIKEYVEKIYTEKDLKEAKEKYEYCTPFTKESLYYREIFESFYKGQAKWIKSFWMPNKTWEGCKDVKDPSARVLSNYGDSGK